MSWNEVVTPSKHLGFAFVVKGGGDAHYLACLAGVMESCFYKKNLKAAESDSLWAFRLIGRNEISQR